MCISKSRLKRYLNNSTQPIGNDLKKKKTQKNLTPACVIQHAIIILHRNNSSIIYSQNLTRSTEAEIRPNPVNCLLHYCYSVVLCCCCCCLFLCPEEAGFVYQSYCVCFIWGLQSLADMQTLF